MICVDKKITELEFWHEDALVVEAKLYKNASEERYYIYMGLTGALIKETEDEEEMFNFVREYSGEYEDRVYIIEKILYFATKNGTGISKKDLKFYPMETLKNALKRERSEYLNNRPEEEDYIDEIMADAWEEYRNHWEMITYMEEETNPHKDYEFEHTHEDNWIPF